MIFRSLNFNVTPVFLMYQKLVFQFDRLVYASMTNYWMFISRISSLGLLTWSIWVARLGGRVPDPRLVRPTHPEHAILQREQCKTAFLSDHSIEGGHQSERRHWARGSWPFPVPAEYQVPTCTLVQLF